MDANTKEFFRSLSSGWYTRTGLTRFGAEGTFTGVIEFLRGPGQAHICHPVPKPVAMVELLKRPFDLAKGIIDERKPLYGGSYDSPAVTMAEELAFWANGGEVVLTDEDYALLEHDTPEEPQPPAA